uniref:Secreted protein n=1 Tax=Trypanosoma congolense (strain IL3000) TaxID=1068625 RepID=G0USM5_TRYCI|nr:hypothetical protein, unlikely [Trypanosoma congolense IL3000]
MRIAIVYLFFPPFCCSCHASNEKKRTETYTHTIHVYIYIYASLCKSTIDASLALIHLPLQEPESFRYISTLIDINKYKHTYTLIHLFIYVSSRCKKKGGKEKIINPGNKETLGESDQSVIQQKIIP